MRKLPKSGKVPQFSMPTRLITPASHWPSEETPAVVFDDDVDLVRSGEFAKLREAIRRQFGLALPASLPSGR